MTTVSFTWSYGRFREIKSKLRRKKPHKTNQASNFLRGSFSIRENVRAPIQFRRESQPQNLKIWIFLKDRPIHFHMNATSVVRLVKWNQLSFFKIEISTSEFLSQFSVSCRSDSNSEVSSGCCHRSDAWSHLE